jgi:glycosyltransferase involved in cell wall biosynthesis
MLDASIFRKVLFVGPDYRNHRGGIGAVLDVYRQYIDGFRFIATHNSQLSATGGAFLALKAMVKLCWVLLTDRHIRIVHIHSASRASFYRKYCVFLLVRYIFRRKVIYHIHGGKFHLFYETGSRWYRKLVHHLLTKADHVVCLSAYWQHFFTGTFDVKAVSILNNPISVPDAPLQETGEEGQLSLLFLGRICDNKGIFDLLDLLARNQNRYRHKIKLKIGGDGEVERLKEHIISRQIDDIAEYAGWVQNRQKHHLLSNCDVFVLPSYHEGLPVSVLEAMSYGKPVIATTVGGIPEVVKEGRNGFLFTPGDKNALERHLDHLFYHVTERRKMGKQSLDMVAPYRIDNVLEELQAIYVKLLNGHNHELTAE